MLSHRDCMLVWDFQSHQPPDPVDDTIQLSEQEFEERSNKNVERWVSRHIIPVRGLSPCSHLRKTRLTRLYF
jgi:hypothetical protein